MEAQADDTIILPEDSTVIAGDISRPPTDFITFHLWVPETVFICDEGCGFGTSVSVGTYDAEDELIFRIQTDCEETFFSNDSDPRACRSARGGSMDHRVGLRDAGQ